MSFDMYLMLSYLTYFTKIGEKLIWLFDCEFFFVFGMSISLEIEACTMFVINLL